MNTKVLMILLALIPLTQSLTGQEPDPKLVGDFPRHFFSINPINSFLLDQAGVSYEFKPGRFSIGLTGGYKYAGGRNYSRFFIASSANHGAYEFYSGMFAVPQMNFYLNKPRKRYNTTLVYLSVKGIYKYLHVDSTEYHVWDNTLSENYFLYRKMDDHVNIIGGSLNFGLKFGFKHHFIDINFGPAIIKRSHKMHVVAQAHTLALIPSTPSVTPLDETFSNTQKTMNFSVSFGGFF
jgi:hypothetical protein